MIEFHGSTAKSDDAFVSMQCGDPWCWIADHDLDSKRAFAIMLMLFTPADTGVKENLPLVTIPAP